MELHPFFMHVNREAITDFAADRGMQWSLSYGGAVSRSLPF